MIPMEWYVRAGAFVVGALFGGLSVGAWLVLADAFPPERTEG